MSAPDCWPTSPTPPGWPARSAKRSRRYGSGVRSWPGPGRALSYGTYAPLLNHGVALTALFLAV